MGASSPPPGNAAVYERLMRVSFQHAFYNDTPDCVFRDLVLRPTPATANLMKTLGLMFIPEIGGFTLLHAGGPRQRLLRYIRLLQTQPDEPRCRLSFAAFPAAGDFVNITDMPLDTRLTEVNFLFTNRVATIDGARAVIDPQGSGGGAPLVKVVTPQHPLRLPDDAVNAIVETLAGEIVFDTGNQVQARRRIVQGAGKEPVARAPYIDFSHLSEGPYIVRVGMRDGSEVVDTYIYAAGSPIPAAFVELFLTAAAPNSPGVYPVVAGEDGLQVNFVDYQIRLRSRATEWSYHIVPRPDLGDLENLSIERTGDRDTTEPGAFTGPPEVVYLPDGSKAYDFRSDDPVVLQKRSPLHFRLLGRRVGAMAEDVVLFDRLPIPGSSQVSPGDSGKPAVSMTFVHI